MGLHHKTNGHETVVSISPLIIMESMTAVSNVAKSRAPYGTCTTRINAGWVHYIQLCDRMRSEKNAALPKGVDYTYWRHWRSYKIRWTS